MFSTLFIKSVSKNCYSICTDIPFIFITQQLCLFSDAIFKTTLLLPKCFVTFVDQPLLLCSCYHPMHKDYGWPTILVTLSVLSCLIPLIWPPEIFNFEERGVQCTTNILILKFKD